MTNSSFFNCLDYIYIAIMLISSVFGFIKGFTRSFLSLCAWICSGFLSIIISPYLYPFTKKYFTEPSIVQGVSTGISYILILIILLLITHLISDSIKRSVLSGLDRAIGVLFGLFRGIFLPFCICTIFLIFDIAKKKFAIIDQSKISGILFETSRLTIIPYLEENGAIQKIKSKQKGLKNDHQKSIEEAFRTSKFKIIPKRELEKK